MSGSGDAMVDEATERTWPPLAPLVVALGQLPLLLLVPSDVSFTLPASSGLLTLLAGEGLLFLVLAADIVRTRPRLRGLAAFVLATVGFGGVLLVGLRATADLWLVALALVVTMTVAAYLLHRVELLRLGLVGGDEA